MRVIIEGTKAENPGAIKDFMEMSVGAPIEFIVNVTDADPNPFQWTERLEYDHKVSTVHPIVKGTWVTAGEIVSLIVDGYTWKQVLHMHPELDEDDIRACMLYMTEEEGGK